MEFQTRISGTFVMNMTFILLAFCMAAYGAVYPILSPSYFHYLYMVWLIIGFTRLIVYRKYFNFVAGRKTILVVNGSFIYDLANDIKYNWDDINSVYEDNAYLYINLLDPDVYLAAIKNPFKRLKEKLTGESFRINIDMVNINADVLLEILEEYSDEAIEIEKSRK